MCQVVGANYILESFSSHCSGIAAERTVPKVVSRPSSVTGEVGAQTPLRRKIRYSFHVGNGDQPVIEENMQLSLLTGDSYQG
jgi:hypothetical protein